MSARRHLLVIDPTAFAGGSKVATENILRLLDLENIRITVLSADKHSWSWPHLKRLHLVEPGWLARQEQGVPYFLRHAIIALQLVLLRLLHGRFDVALGASGPGVDLALYLAKPLLGYRIVQLVHGPVAYSRTIGRCLRTAEQVHYLESARDTLLSALSTVSHTRPHLEPPRFQILQNGLPQHAWPSTCQTEHPVVFWAASLLKWKGLDTLLDALNRLHAEKRPQTHICYIRPAATTLPISEAPVDIRNIHWHEAPGDLDRLRASANIFVSTSNKEPFGLSILEAMAAGHCVLIPKDGAFWDRTLQDGIDCVKYRPDDAADLSGKLRVLSDDMNRVRAMGRSARRQAVLYRAETRYASIKSTLENLSTRQALRAPSQVDTEVSP
ncbi:MAG: glycosyltransferase family 4 protein [Gammaproteobacteria bacterium]|nr:glycosyltransferase family 4 protein [Gammaproteobacteria bacterium]